MPDLSKGGLSKDLLVIEGKHKKHSDQHFTLELKPSELTEVFLGFDKTFSIIEDRSLGLAFEPLRLTYTKDGKEEVLYIIIGFKRFLRRSDDRQWFQLLTRWSTPGK